MFKNILNISRRTVNYNYKPPLKYYIKKSKLKNLLLYENNILNKLNHNNIVKAYGIKNNNTELLLEKGDCDLYEYVKKYNFSLDNKQIIFIIKQVIEGINYIHDKNIAHNDIKLENIIVKNSYENNATL